jgi:hypothetical protein
MHSMSPQLDMAASVNGSVDECRAVVTKLSGTIFHDPCTIAPARHFRDEHRHRNPTKDSAHTTSTS